MMTTKQWLYVGAAAVVIMAAAYYLTDKPAKKDKPAPAKAAPPEPERRKAGRPKGSKTHKGKDGVIVETPPEKAGENAGES